MVLLDWPSIPESEPLEAQSAELDPTWLLQAIEPEARGGRPRKHQGTSRGFAENEWARDALDRFGKKRPILRILLTLCLRHCGSLTIRMPAGAVGHGGGGCCRCTSRYKQVAICRHKSWAIYGYINYIPTGGDFMIFYDGSTVLLCSTHKDNPNKASRKYCLGIFH